MKERGREGESEREGGGEEGERERVIDSDYLSSAWLVLVYYPLFWNFWCCKLHKIYV